MRRETVPSQTPYSFTSSIKAFTGKISHTGFTEATDLIEVLMALKIKRSKSEGLAEVSEMQYVCKVKQPPGHTCQLKAAL